MEILIFDQLSQTKPTKSISVLSLLFHFALLLSMPLKYLSAFQKYIK